jgi:hypothetical protein
MGKKYSLLIHLSINLYMYISPSSIFMSVYLQVFYQSVKCVTQATLETILNPETKNLVQLQHRTY